MQQTDEKSKLDRRAFLRGTAVAGAYAAVATSAPGLVTAGTSQSSTTEDQHDGYQLTQHVVDYYKSAAC